MVATRRSWEKTRDPAVQVQGPAQDDVAPGIRGAKFVEGAPGTDVAPAHIHRHQGDIVRFFHEAVIQGDAGEFIVSRGQGCRRDLGANSLQPLMEVGEVSGHRLQEHVPAEKEDAAVPVIAASLQKSLGPGELRLLDEGRGFQAPGRQGLAGLEVAIAGVGAGGGDTEGDQITGLGQRCALIQGLMEGCGVPDIVVCGEDGHNVGAGLLVHQPGRQTHRGRGVFAFGFEP